MKETAKVRQHTGLKDKNGVYICEGDIIKAVCNPALIGNHKVYAVGIATLEDDKPKLKVIMSKNYSYKKIYVGDGVLSYPIEHNFIERDYVLYVVGNIYDNPELL